MSGTELLAPRPAHIPEAVVYDFDIFRDSALLKDPHERVKEVIRDAPPLFWTPRNGGHWMALKYSDAFKVLRDPEYFSSSPISDAQRAAMAARMPPGTPRIPALIPILMDPPSHTIYRKPLQSAFSPKTMMALKSDIEKLAHNLIDATIKEKSCDFVPAVAEQFPVRVFLKMMGLPAERLAEFRLLVREVFEPSGNDPALAGMRIRRIADAMMDVILARRTDPKDDLISQLWSMEIQGEPMTLELMEDYTSLLFLAGLDTVINAIGFGIRHLAMNPQLQAELRANPGTMVEATEELLRRYTFTVPMRRVLKDTELGGLSIKTGEMVMLYLPAADLDASEFASPEVFDPERENKVHMSFGAGPHRCLGSHLARIELQTLYSVVVEKMPTFRLDPDKPVKFHVGNLLAVTSLPLRWD